MGKKLLLSAKKNHDVIKNVIVKLQKIPEIELTLHDPRTDFLDLENLSNLFKDIDYLVVKVGSECSIDLLHYANLYNIPTLHDVETVLMCKNKVSLDQVLRKTFSEHSSELEAFYLPKSWTNSLSNLEKFKKWARSRLPIVIKSHYQHDKYMRFNFLVRDIKEVDEFCKRYCDFLYYDVYIQEFIESDGIERKIYVIGDKVFGIERENPIYVFLRERPDNIDVNTLKRKTFKVSGDMKKLAKILSKGLNLEIFGFDLIKPFDREIYYLVDLNDFPGLRGIKNIEELLVDFLITKIKTI